MAAQEDTNQEVTIEAGLLRKLALKQLSDEEVKRHLLVGCSAARRTTGTSSSTSRRTTKDIAAMSAASPSSWWLVATDRAGQDTPRECLHCKECGGSGCPDCDADFFGPRDLCLA